MAKKLLISFTANLDDRAVGSHIMALIAAGYQVSQKTIGEPTTQAAPVAQVVQHAVPVQVIPAVQPKANGNGWKRAKPKQRRSTEHRVRSGGHFINPHPRTLTDEVLDLLEKQPESKMSIKDLTVAIMNIGYQMSSVGSTLSKMRKENLVVLDKYSVQALTEK